MAPKGQDTPSSIRIRENQARSRARRRDLIESLQTRVQEFELNGVRATQEMQQAARKVARENERLRNLLEIHGVLRKEVDTYLRSFEDSAVMDRSQITSMKTPVLRAVSNAPPRNSVSESPSFEHPLGQDLEHEEHAILDEPWNANQPFDGCQARSLNGRYVESVPSPESSTIRVQRFAEMQHLENVDHLRLAHTPATPDTSDFCPNDPDCFCPPMTTIEDGPSRPGLETSCETAARIIIGMGGYRDQDSVRASLGCSGRGDCNVKNTTVLQIMGNM